MQTINDENFLDFIQGNNTITFTASWCGVCKMLKPVLNELSKDFVIGEVDVATNPIVSAQFKVRSLPTTILLKDGVEVKRFVGGFSKQDFKDEKI